MKKTNVISVFYMSRRLISLIATFSLAFPALALRPKPDLERLKGDRMRLDELQRVFVSTPQFSQQFWRASKRLADERGPEIISAVMARAQMWRGEEGLIFVPLVSLLPRGPTLKVLQQYQRSKRKSDRIWAGEFITEFDMFDTKEAVQKYSRNK